MNTKRLLLYLGLNALVSALVTVSVLALWDRSRPPARPCGEATAVQPVPGAPTQPPTASPPPLPTSAPLTYVVQSGDTLGSIADNYSVSVEALMQANGLTDPNRLDVGQTLIIPVSSSTGPTATPAQLPTNPVEPPLATSTRDPLAPQPRLSVREVRSPGQLAEETLVLVNQGGPVELLGWTLSDAAGRDYTFPALTLFEGGAVNLHTTAGQNTVTDLYWGQTEAVWATGQQVLLTDPAGNLQTTFTLP